MNLKFYKYKSGKKIFDWKVPKEWIIEGASIKFKKKEILNLKNSNLHVISYSSPINKKFNLSVLKKNLYYLKKKPQYIPYVTSYYKKNWGFCLKYKQFKALKPGVYDCKINSKFKNGFLVNASEKIKGKSNKENLISTYLCHPSMANNELSGPLVMLGIYNRIKKWKNKNFTYRFLINPETIGSLCFLHSHGKKLKKTLNSGLVLTCLGGPEKKLSYKLSKYGNSTLDRLFIHLSKKNKISIREFNPAGGSDERQYNSPGFDLPVGNISRSVYGKYDQYHNSGDDKKFMDIKKIEKSINNLEYFLKINDKLLPIKRFMPYGELMLSKKNLYPSINFTANRDKLSTNNLADKRVQLDLILTILSFADGIKNILDIVELRDLDIDEALIALEVCLKNKLVKFVC